MKTNNYTIPILLLVVSLVLFIIVFFVGTGCACGGWNLINPICWINFAACSAATGAMKLAFLVGGIVLFLVSILEFIRVSTGVSILRKIFGG